MSGSLKHTRRIYRIAITLAHYDALFGLERLSLPFAARAMLWLLRDTRYRKLRPGQRLAKAFERLGPTFIKLGQALSVRPDLVGEEVADDLANLRDDLPPFSSARAIAVIESEFGKPLSELFATFEEKPVAAASIAQVHFATLHDGSEVAVKVLRPHIDRAFARDINLLLWLARLAERKRPHYRRLKPVESVKTFAQAISFELDLRYEAAAAMELRDNMKEVKGFHVPDIHWTHVSERVLTTERVRGIALSDMEALRAANMDMGKLVEHASHAFFHQVFVDGFFHADLHPGNLFVLPDNTLAAVDFGIMGRVDRDTRLYLAQMLWCFLKEDYEGVARVHISAGYVPRHTCVKQFAQANRAIAKPIFGKALNEISIAQLLRQLFNVAETFQMQAQPQLLMLQKTMMLTEGVGRMLKPDVNMWKLAEPLIAAWAKDNLSPRARMRDSLSEGADALRSAPALMRRLERVMDDVQSGGIALHRETLDAISGGGKSSRGWLIFAWAALLMLGGILALVALR